MFYFLPFFKPCTLCAIFIVYFGRLNWKKFDHSSFFIIKNRSKIISFFISLLFPSGHKVTIYALDNCYSFVPFQSLSDVLLLTMCFSFRPTSDLRQTALKIILIPLANISFRWSMKSLIVSVNKLDYLLNGTRANIWPQIDGHSSFWVDYWCSKLEIFHHHLLHFWAGQMVYLSKKKKIICSTFSSVFVLIDFVAGVSFLWFPHEIRATDGLIHIDNN